MGDRRTDLEAVLKLVQSQLTALGPRNGSPPSTLSKEEEEAQLRAEQDREADRAFRQHSPKDSLRSLEAFRRRQSAAKLQEGPTGQDRVPSPAPGRRSDK